MLRSARLSAWIQYALLSSRSSSSALAPSSHNLQRQLLHASSSLLHPRRARARPGAVPSGASLAGVQQSALEEDEAVWTYIERRAAGKQYTPEEELAVMTYMTHKAEGTGEFAPDPLQDTDVHSGVRHWGPRAHDDDVARTRPDGAARQGSNDVAHQVSRAPLTPDQGRSSTGADPSSSATSERRGTFNFRTDSVHFKPRKRTLSDDELKRELILKSLSYEVNSRLSRPAAVQGMVEGLPTFLAQDVANVLGANPRSATAMAGAAEERQADRSFGTQLLKVGIVGIPNAGKSTLTNYLVGGTIAAISRRPETTRTSVLGSFVEGTTQVVLYDTPGMKGARDFDSRSHAMRVASAWTHVQECDAMVLIVDIDKQMSRYATTHVDELAQVLGSDDGPVGFSGEWTRRPVTLLLNKLDLLGHDRLKKARELAMHLSELCKAERVCFVSAKTGAGMNVLREHLVAQARPGEWAFPPGMPTDMSWPDLAAELVREKLYWGHSNEVPYQLVPQCTAMEELADGKVCVDVDLLVRTQRMKRIVSGENDERVTQIQGRVGAELAHMLKRRTEVKVKVRVRKDAVLPEMYR